MTPTVYEASFRHHSASTELAGPLLGVLFLILLLDKQKKNARRRRINA